MSIVELIYAADSISQTVMFTLLMLSIFSCTIIFDKLYKFAAINSSIKKFDSLFWSGQGLDSLYDNIKNRIDNPLAAIFITAINELRRADTSMSARDPMLKIGAKDRIMLSMNLVKNREAENLEKYLGFLAGVGAYSPFIGVFGTVCGIMHSFQSIAVSKNTSLAAVAPGIAEALLATAIGLITAILASVFYSYLASISNYIENRMDDFVTELYTILSRNIDEERL
ncbi:MAG: MotA/TolQ/ExbB proton channel family protein, partial [Rickettsiaceae bacterium]|nr:MotA/TolQ/ExbB proton channel family protein [Rickettsiaceae bacterium]